jgi:hypothetical protein
MTSYALTTPVRDEMEHLPTLLRGLEAQSVPPMLWVVVDDRSTDGSRAWLEAQALSRPWLVPISAADESDEYLGAHIAIVKKWGLEQAASLAKERGFNPELVGVLDADVELPPDHYELIARAFTADPNLGVCSSLLYLEDETGRHIEPFQSGEHPRGPTQTFRLTCLNAIGGLPPYPGFDGAANVKAQAHGWTTRVAPGAVAIHRRPTATRFGTAAGFKRKGEYAWFLGVHPLLVSARAAAYTLPKPHDAGWHFIRGWVGSALAQKSRCPDPEIRAGYGWPRVVSAARRAVSKITGS